jgi:hypothetical protein
MEVLHGANAAALRFGPEGDREVIQFETAELIDPRVYRLESILRGQAGTDGTAPDTWPPGTQFILLDGAVDQLDLPISARTLERHYRVGSATRAYTHRSYEHRVEAFDGVGLRPYRPAHLTAERQPDGGIQLAWVRRGRIDGDSWAGTDVPLGEEHEAYLVRVIARGATVRETEVDAAAWTYSASQQEADGASGLLTFEVAQVSVRFGAGPYGRIETNG